METSMTDTNVRILASHLPLASLDVPPDLIPSRDHLVDEAAHQGLSVTIDPSIENLIIFNSYICKLIPDSWFPLLPTPQSAPAFWLNVRDKEGATVACYAGTFLNCSEKSWGEKIGDLTAFHDDPEAAQEDWAFCASPLAFEARGRVGWLSAGWLAPRWRGRPRRFHLLGRMVRLVAETLWEPDCMGGLVDPDIAPVWRLRAAGPCTIEKRPGVLLNQKGVGRLPMHFCFYPGNAMKRELLDLGSPIPVNSATA